MEVRSQPSATSPSRSDVRGQCDSLTVLTRSFLLPLLLLLLLLPHTAATRGLVLPDWAGSRGDICPNLATLTVMARSSALGITTTPRQS